MHPPPTKTTVSTEATEASKKKLEIKMTTCLHQPCTFTVFRNGEHQAGQKIEVTPADMKEFSDLGEFLGPKMGCVSTGMR